jgi:hypothetical protein
MALQRVANQVFDDTTAPPRLVARKAKGSWREVKGGDLEVVENRQRAQQYERMPALPLVHPLDAALPARRLGFWGPGALARAQAQCLVKPPR